jgi:hypothetical protein
VITSALGRLAAGDNLSLDEMTEVIDQVMQGSVPENAIAVLLTALRHKGETTDEIAGAALAMRRHMTPIRTTRTGLVDTCGTGGIGSDLFNISTAAAIVTAAGVPVAKHGNRSITSRSGSADVLAELGVNINATVAQVEACLDELGLCFCFAPLMHLRCDSGVARSWASRRCQPVGLLVPASLLVLASASAAIPRRWRGCCSDWELSGPLSWDRRAGRFACAPDRGDQVVGDRQRAHLAAGGFGLASTGRESLVTMARKPAAADQRTFAGDRGPPRTRAECARRLTARERVARGVCREGGASD